MELVEEQSRQCTRCGERLPLSAFGFKFPDRPTRLSYCRACARAISRAHYQRNTARYKQRAARTKASTKAANRARLRALLQQSACADCGESDLAVLEFDHREPATKRRDISTLLGIGCSWQTIEQELAKCDIVCANCHRRRTARQFGWHKLGEPAPPELPALPRRGAPDYERIKSVRSGLARRHRNRLYVWRYLLEHPCVVCGISDPVVLEFDHRGNKYRDIGWLVPASCCATIAAEIEKCRVLCANCHRRSTARSAGRDR